MIIEEQQILFNAEWVPKATGGFFKLCLFREQNCPQLNGSAIYYYSCIFYLFRYSYSLLSDELSAVTTLNSEKMSAQRLDDARFRPNTAQRIPKTAF